MVRCELSWCMGITPVSHCRYSWRWRSLNFSAIQVRKNNNNNNNNNSNSNYNNSNSNYNNSNSNYNNNYMLIIKNKNYWKIFILFQFHFSLLLAHWCHMPVLHLCYVSITSAGAVPSILKLLLVLVLAHPQSTASTAPPAKHWRLWNRCSYQ